MKLHRSICLPFIAAWLVLLTGCRFSASEVGPDKITSLNIIDRNGMSETISSQDRLDAFQGTNFLAPQPYQKVLRIYGKDKEGSTRSTITSYHPNGQVKQYLEAVNNRAFGFYREWHLNGVIKVESHVIGGVADINTQAEESWLFDGLNRAWDDEGNLIAEILYSKGELQGESCYYHPNGTLWKSLPHEKNLLSGTQRIYLENGTLFQTIEHKEGVKEGLSVRYWNPDRIAYQEEYKGGLLYTAHYYDLKGNCVAEIKEGNGLRALFGKMALQELQEYRNGIQEGEVKVFNESQALIRIYAVKNNEKHGEEIDYFHPSLPRLLTTWSEGVIQGPAKTWYENGNLESQREMSQNKKNGLSTAWYRDGALMLVEEYDNDKLIKGEYYRKGEKIPVSMIEKGKGIATLFDSEGNFSRKIVYQEGKPFD